MPPLPPFLPPRINEGPWLAGYSLPVLQARLRTERVVLPICPLGTPPEDLARLGPLILPPLYQEALDADLEAALVARIRHCFPFLHGTSRHRESEDLLDIVRIPPRRVPPPVRRPRVLAFSVDTAVEQHGPHLPLATDTLESYAVLHALADRVDGFAVGPPVDYGHLTWGLAFGCSIDLTPTLTTRYVRRFIDAVNAWVEPESLYVADVHGSLVHRHAVQEAMRGSRCRRARFRWLFDPLGEFAGDRGDMHAGGVETTLIERISPDLVDPRFWPGRIDHLAEGQMTVARAVELSSDLPRFSREVEAHGWNGIVGDIRNYHRLDAPELFRRMVDLAASDVAELLHPPHP